MNGFVGKFEKHCVKSRAKEGGRGRSPLPRMVEAGHPGSCSAAPSHHGLWRPARKQDHRALTAVTTTGTILCRISSKLCF